MSTLNRLNKARKSAAEYAARHPDHKHYNNWRHWITRTIKGRNTHRDLENKSLVYCNELSDLGWRVVGDAHEIVRLGYTGWYADNFQSAMYVGVVLQLPARDGVEKYVPAIRHTDFDTATVYLAEITEDKDSAARWADQNAERQAEESREFDAKDQAEQQIAEARTEIHVINRQLLPALKDLKGANLKPSICSMVRAGITDLLGERAEQFRTIKKLQDDFWKAVPQ